MVLTVFKIQNGQDFNACLAISNFKVPQLEKNESQSYGSCALPRLVLINKFMNFHHNILNGFQVTERAGLEYKFCYIHFQRAITPNISNAIQSNSELWFLCSAGGLILINNHAKFTQNILNGSHVIERTRLECKFC